MFFIRSKGEFSIEQVIKWILYLFLLFAAGFALKTVIFKFVR